MVFSAMRCLSAPPGAASDITLLADPERLSELDLVIVGEEQPRGARAGDRFRLFHACGRQLTRPI